MKNVALLIAPKWLLIILCGVLIIDTSVLMILGKINFGTVLPGVLGFGGLMVFWQNQAITRLKQQYPAFRIVWSLGVTGFFLWLVTLAFFVFWTLQITSAGDRDSADAQYVVVLGAGLQGTEPSPTLRARLDTVLHFSEINPHAWVVVSGGQGMDEMITEAAAMASYLTRKGMAASRILLEADSSTRCNTV